MTTVQEIRAAGSQILTSSTPIIEPLAAQANLSKKLTRFGDHYNLKNSSHLYRYLVALCGEAGAGSLKKELLLPRLEQQLEATHFIDLDRLYGDALALPRLSEEIYSLDPLNEILSSEEWLEIQAKDADYRARCLIWMRAILEGPTLKGISLAAEAALGVECDVFERYKYIENAASDAPITITNIGLTNSRNEFVIIPREPFISEKEKRRIVRLVDKIKPTNSVGTLFDGDYLRNEMPINEVIATSERFRVNRFVTGRPDVAWPAVDPLLGYWLEPNVEKEAPTYAFMDRQDAAIYLTINAISASTSHTGSFNKEQAGLFSHLSSVPGPTYYFDPTQAYDKRIAPIQVSIPWTGTPSLQGQQIIINNFYPIGYFGLPNIQFVGQTTDLFWASTEQYAPSTETLLIDLGRTRPCNFIQFEICQKPIDFSVQWSNDNVIWTDVVKDPTFPVTTSVAYLPSLENPWHFFEMNFQMTQARYIRVVFTRRTDSFPLLSTTPFQWSIDVRGLSLMYLIHEADGFVEDQGVDILGNAYRCELAVSTADNVIDIDDDEFPSIWRSQPNPTPHAVEALYFDLRDGFELGTQGFLDTFSQADLDTRSQSDLERYHTDGVVIDEIYINPITFGAAMHIYYSLDDTPSWDDKLWIPIPRSYVLKKGFFALQSPTFVKYVKLEFTNLPAQPYQPLEVPNMKPVTFRRFPTWVQNYFNNVAPIQPLPATIQVFDRISIDPLTFGFTKIIDKLTADLQAMQNTPSVRNTSETEVSTFINTLLSSQTPTIQSDVEAKIKFRSPVIWQNDLIQQLNLDRALSRVAAEPRDGFTDTGFNVEQGLPVSPIPVQQSGTDMSQAWMEKNQPTMFFPFRCRHGYQIVQAEFSSKISYEVAIREVGFYRRDYTIPHDEAIYSESLDDTAHVEINDFRQLDWRYIV